MRTTKMNQIMTRKEKRQSNTIVGKVLTILGRTIIYTTAISVLATGKHERGKAEKF